MMVWAQFNDDKSIDEAIKSQSYHASTIVNYDFCAVIYKAVIKSVRPLSFKL